MPFLTCPNCGRLYSSVEWVGYFAVVAPLAGAGFVAKTNRSLAVFLLLISALVALYLYFDQRRPPNKPGMWLSVKRPPRCPKCT